MTAKLFLHGVPDSPAIWRPLLAALDLGGTPVAVPALPAFTAPLPAGFPATKEAYADWAVQQAEALFAQHGPIDIVGHDWGRSSRSARRCCAPISSAAGPSRTR